jgi:predicted secreted protein
MAATDGVHKGDLYRIVLSDGTSEMVGCITTLSWNATMDSTEVPACRGAAAETGGWKKFIPGDKSMTISAEGQVLMAEDWTPHRFFGAMDNETELAFILEPVGPAPTYTPIVGGQRLQGDCWLTSLDVQYPNNEVVTYSLELTVNGKPTSSIIV